MDLPPDHTAYVPGKTARPPDGAFDALRDTARPGMTAAELADSAAWRGGMTCLEAGYYWEAHELWEPVWMALPAGTPAREVARGAIQIANAALKLRMGRPRATRRLCDIAERALQPVGETTFLGVSRDWRDTWLARLRRQAAQDELVMADSPCAK